MRSFRLNQKFGLVIAPFRAFLHNRVSSVKRRNLEFRECVSQPKAHAKKRKVRIGEFPSQIMREPLVSRLDGINRMSNQSAEGLPNLSCTH